MEDLIRKIEKVKGAVRLEVNQKEAIRGRILRFIKGHGDVREGQFIRQNIQRSPKTTFSFLKPMPIFAVIVIIAMLGGGTSFAAQGSLPGDLLYPVKVSFNEKVVAAFKVSAETEAAYQAELAARRLEEASELAAKNGISAETRADIESRFEAHADQVKTRIAELKTKGDVRAAADLASQFEASMKAHEAILVKLESKEEDIRPLRITVDGTLQTITGTREDLESEIATSSEKSENRAEVKVAAEGKLNAATNVIASVKHYIETKKAALGTQATAEAEARLAVAENLVVEGSAKIKAEAYGEAFNLGNQAIRIAEEARALVEAKADLKVDVDLKAPVEIDIRGTENPDADGEVRGGAKAEENAGATSTKGNLKLKLNF